MKNKKLLYYFIPLIVFVVMAGGYYFYVLKAVKKVETPASVNKAEEISPTTSTKEGGTNQKPQDVKVDVKPNVIPESKISEEEKLVRNVVSSFEAAYKARDITKIFSYFTAPSGDLEANTFSRLKDGKDLAGSMGGPTLFSSNTALHSPDSYELVEVKNENDKYFVTVKEVILNQGARIERLRKLEIVKSNGNWLIDKYSSSDQDGKYTGFLSY